MDDPLDAALAAGTLLITANRRLARALHGAYAVRRRAAGETVWESPEILPWGAWLERCWGEWLEDAPAPGGALLLDADRQQLVWERVVAESGEGGALLNVAATARSAVEAWRLLHDWQVALEENSPLLDEEGRAFLRWAGEYRRRCRERGWLDPALLPAFLAARLAAGEWSPPPALWVTGFDELPPAYLRFLDALRAAGCAVTVTAPAEVAGGDAVRLALPDREGELRAAARWARRRLEERPSALIGVVIQDLQGVRGAAERIFTEELLPAVPLPGAAVERRPFNLSLGTPLAEEPVVACALRLLALALGPLELAEVGRLLRSPFLAGAAEEREARALFDARLRRLGQLAWSVAALARLSRPGERPVAGAVPRLHRRLVRLRYRSRRVAARPPGEWSATFAEWLRAVGWAQGCDSRGHQGVEAFKGVLSRLAALAGVAGKMAAGEALARLRRLAVETLFQPEGNEAPIQLLGMLEAGGQRFDCLRLVGLHDEVWPESPRPNPFLPIAVQRRHGLPHASAARELEFAARLTGRLLQSAPEVVVSWPAREGDRALRPSPLIAALPEVAGEEEGRVWWRERWRPGDGERLRDEAGPPLATLPADGAAVGGSGLLQAQAACPFQAFARHRLGVAALERPGPGLDPRSRGELLHAALETAWRELSDSDTLAARDAAAVAELAERAAATALGAWRNRRPRDLPEGLLTLERRRLAGRLAAWLEVERQRGIRFTVVAEEEERTMTVGGVPLRLRIDRVDRLEDGALFLIDYKSGRVSEAGWFGERPDEPQLPLYALALGAELAGLAFGQLKAGELGFKGLAREAGIAAGVVPPEESRLAAGAGGWDGLIDSWREVLERLGAAFAAGTATVSPKGGGRPCRWCELPPLCRVHEADEWAGAGE